MASSLRFAAPTRRLLALIAALPLALPAQTTFTWTGTVDGDWGTDGNWDQTGSPSSIDSVIVNDGGGGTSILGFSAAAADVSVGYLTGTGAVTVGGGGSLVIGGDLNVGCGCVAGTVRVEGGGTGSSAAIHVDMDSTFTVTGSGSSWTTAGSVSTTGPQAALYVQAGATLGVGFDLTLGVDGDDALTIDSGGVVTTAGASALGSNTGFTSTATVTGAGSRWDTGDLVVGAFGQGGLTVSAGGVVNTANADLAYGNVNGPGTTVGTVTVSGSGSQWNISGSLGIGAYLDESLYNAATLTIAEGGTVTVGGGAGVVNLDTNGTLNIGDGGLSGTLNAAEVAFTNSPSDGASAMPATLVFNHTDDITFSAVISGEGVVAKSGSGTTTLTGASTYAGPTLVTAGTLVLDISGDWEGSSDFQVTGTGSTLRIGAASTVAADLTVTDGTAQVIGVLDGGPNENFFTDATLHIPSGGEVIGGYHTFDGTSVLQADGAGAISGGDFLFNNTSTFVASAPGTMTDGALTFAGNRTIVLPDAGIITGGYIELVEDTTTDLDRTGLIVSTFDEDGFLLTEVDLDLFDNAHATISATGAVDGSLVSLWNDSTLSITAAGGIANGELDIYDDAVATLGVDGALDQTVVFVTDNGVLDLNGHDATVVGLDGDGRIVNNSATAVTLTLDTETECGCGSMSVFGGTLAAGTGANAIGLTISGNGALYIVGPQTHTGPTRVVGATLYMVVENDFFGFNGTLTTSQLTLEAGAILAGNGTVGDVTVIPGGASSAIFSPGDDLFANPVGTLTTGNVTLAGHTRFEINLADASAGAGIGTDLLQSSAGSFTFSSTLGDTLTLMLESGDGFSTTFANFDPNVSGSWTIASFGGGIVGYDPSKIIVDSTLFSDAFSGAWSTGLANGDHDLTLIYTAIPEPAAYAGLSALSVLGAVALRRRRRAV